MIYCIGAFEDGADDPVALKIGHTKAESAEPRRATLQTGCPHELRIQWVIPWGTTEQESELHRAFANRRLRGEWFRPDFSLVEALEHLAGDDPWRPLVAGEEYVLLGGRVYFIDDAVEGGPAGLSWPIIEIEIDMRETDRWLHPKYAEGFRYIDDVRHLLPLKMPDILRAAADFLETLDTVEAA